MTTTITLASRDFIVVGADSLATVSADLVDPIEVLEQFFDKKTGDLKVDAGGPLLANVRQILDLSESRPVNQLPSVTKLFSLAPKNAAAVFAGASRIGDITVRNLVEGFVNSDKFKSYKRYTIRGLAERFRDFIVSVYEAEIPQESDRPVLEIIVSGYSTVHRKPEIFKIVMGWDWQKKQFLGDVSEEVTRGNYDIKFGGQYDVIQRVVMGVDIRSWLNLNKHCLRVLNEYKRKVDHEAASQGVNFQAPQPDPKDPDLDLFGVEFGGVTRSLSDVGGLSPKAGIEFVEFLISTMIKSQEFSPTIPTVGGEIHLAILMKESGFRWINQPSLPHDGD